MSNLERILSIKLEKKELTKKQILDTVSETLGLPLDSKEIKRHSKSGCDNWFGINKEIAEYTDVYINVYFKNTYKRGVYQITEVSAEVQCCFAIIK